MSTSVEPSSLTDAQYHELAGEALARVERWVDRLADDDVLDIDARRTGGLLELSFPNRTQIILNTQPPLHELWMAARAGGYHYQWRDGAWRDSRSGETFWDALYRCAGEQAQPVSLPPIG